MVSFDQRYNHLIICVLIANKVCNEMCHLATQCIKVLM